MTSSLYHLQMYFDIDSSKYHYHTMGMWQVAGMNLPETTELEGNKASEEEAMDLLTTFLIVPAIIHTPAGLSYHLVAAQHHHHGDLGMLC